MTMTYQDAEEQSLQMRGAEMRPLTRDEARALCLPGWNIRCNRCGSYGAQWNGGERPGWGSLALCTPHGRELHAEHRRHERALRELRAVNFEQETEWVPAAAFRVYD